MIKILFNEKRIYLCPDYKSCIAQFQISNAFILFATDEAKMQRYLDLLLLSEIEQLIIECDETIMIGRFKHWFSYISAGGGLVKNCNGACLFIFRRNKWDLPKGKLESDESIESCALREVQEETGLQNVAILQPLLNTFHFYIEDRMVFKETFWYLMESEDKYLVPQTKEGITKALWVHPNNIHLLLQNSFESIRDLFASLTSMQK